MSDYVFSINSISPTLCIIVTWIFGYIIGFFVRDFEFLIDEMVFYFRNKRNNRYKK